MNCTHCEKQLPAGVKFCPACGQAVVARCSACTAALIPGARFCAECGASTGASAVSAGSNSKPEAREPRAYTPRHLADRILQSRSALEGERKQVTVLFADVKGSMELAAQLDPEEWHTILERFFAILTEGVHRFEGTVNQYTGDGIMALFGAPIAHEDHAQRACYAALHLREALRDFARDLKRQHGLDFATRIGLNSGDVVVGRIGDDLRMDYTAQGHTVGLAQRMEGLASGGSIYVSEHTATFARGYFGLEDLGAFTIKGVNKPVHVHELTGLGSARSRFDISRSRGLSRFVGRDADMQTLETALEEARAGNGQVVGIVAEAGTGKSRLCFEFLERCKAKGLTTQVGRALAHGKNIPLVPMLEVFRAWFGITESDTDRVARDRIAGRLLQMDENFRDLLPVVFEFFGVADPSRPAPRMDADGKQRQLFAVLRKLVREQQADAPPVTLIEDLHWIDAGSEAFLEQWVEAAAGSHSLLILNFRPEYHAAWMNRSWYRQIPLAPLRPEAVRALLEDLIGQHPSTAGLAESIHARTGGNPFFTEEIVQSLIESGALTGVRGGYQLTTPVSTLQVPATVQALLSARIDRLAEREKQVLQAASVIGKDFSEPVLERVLADVNAGSGPDLRAALRQLRDGEFVHEVSLYPVAEYTFKHPLTQEVAQSSQLQERRRRLHAAVARAIEANNPQQLDETAPLIAHHYDHAVDVNNAARWHRRAAEWTGVKDVGAAVRHWFRVRELAHRMGEGEESTALMINACFEAMRIGGFRIGEVRQQWEPVYRDGCIAATRSGDLRALARLHAQYGAVRGNVLGSIADYERYTREAVTIADQLADPGLRCGTRAYLCFAAMYAGHLDETTQVADEIIEIARGDVNLGADTAAWSPLIWSLIWRAMRAGLGHDPVTALRELPKIRQLAVRHGNDEMVLWASVTYETELLLRAGSGDDLRRLAKDCGQVLSRIDAGTNLNRMIMSLASSAVNAVELNWDAALADANEAGRWSEAHGAHPLEAQVFESIARAQLGLGSPAAGRAAAAEGIRRMQQSGSIYRPGVYAVKARAQLALHEPAGDIEATLDEYTNLLKRTGIRLFEGELHEIRAELAAREGWPAVRVKALQDAWALYSQMGLTTRADVVREALDTAGSAS